MGFSYPCTISGKWLNCVEGLQTSVNTPQKQYEVWKYISTIDDASLSEITEGSGVARPTVRQALLRLVELGKIKRIGRGRATRYAKIYILGNGNH